jgi:SAM-dependent methyltransferase
MPIGKSPIIFQESKLAHQILDGLEGLEIGPAAHNPFGLRTRNVGLSPDRDPVDHEFFKQSQLKNCGSFAPIHISADAANIPLPNSSTDFVLHSHVWEHLSNPLVALEEWVRLTRSGGYIFVIVPKRDAAPTDIGRPVTSLVSLVQNYNRKTYPEPGSAEMQGSGRGHYTVFSLGLLRDIGRWFNLSHLRARLDEVAFQETDDKVGNGHTIVWQVKKFAGPLELIEACFQRIKLLLARDPIRR